MKKIYLTQNWSLWGKKLHSPLAVQVPGCVHTELVRHGIIGDPFWRDENRRYQWIEKEDWEYSCVFDALPKEDASLVFEGLDTYAEITLNGTLLGAVDNMFIPHSFPVKELLREKDNRLCVRFLSPTKMVEGKPPLSGAFTTERLYSRKMQCTYGWDWVDRFVSCGIFRPVYLAYANGIDVENVYIYTENLDRFGAQIYTEINFSHYEKGSVAHVEILSPDGTRAASADFYADREKMIRRFDIVSPQLWYPNGYGEQPLYKMVITVGENRFEQTFGIRTLKILQLPDGEGSEYWKRAKRLSRTEAGRKYLRSEQFFGFQVVVNGVRIFCKGGNWVPCEPFPSAESDEKISYLVKTAKEMGANFLRVWGGGIFEKAAFYDACDREGILVAQDFLMACGHYPEKESWFIDALTKESEFAVKYLRNHPCLAWWHGDNENATRGSDTQEDYTGRSSGLTGLAPQIWRYDFSRVFLPSSPYGGDGYASLTCGTAHTSNHVSRTLEYFHTTDCRDYQDYFEQFVARFVSEEPTLGAICRPSLLKFMTEEDLLEDESEAIWQYHTKGNDALPREIFRDMSTFARKLFGDFQNGEDRFFKYKYLQYEWMRQHFENCRSALGYCNGEIFWMFNDCWPAAAGWSIVDYYGLPKAAYYCFKRCAAPVVGSVKEREDRYILTVSNDTDAEKTFSVNARLLELSSEITEADTHSLQGTVAPYGTVELVLPWQSSERFLVICDILYEEGRDRCFHKSGKPYLRPCDQSKEGVEVIEKSENTITLRAKSYVHAVELEGACLFDDNYFILLSGETKTVGFRRMEQEGESGFEIRGYTLM